jgi:hypothetical protein
VAYWIRVNGTTAATDIGAHSAPTWETLADGGNGEASFEFSMDVKSDHQYLQPDKRLEIFYGTSRVWLGRIADWDRDAGRVIGRGIHTDAYQIPAIDGSGNTTRDFGIALPVAISNGWLANNFDLVSGSADGDSTDPMMIGDLLDLIAEQTGKRWGQRPNTGIYLNSDPTEPRWLAMPEASVFGATNEDRPTHLVGRFFDGTNNVTTTRGSGSPMRAMFVDLTERNTITLAQANAILDANLARMGSRNGWVNGTTLHREQLTTVGGVPAALEAVRAGHMVRALGVGYEGYGSSSPDVVIGKTRYTAGEDTIYVEPVNTAPRNAVDVWAAQPKLARR